MPFDNKLEQFLASNRITQETWEKANVPWSELVAIANDHLARQTELRETAELCARVMQELPKVHSVRWRVKDVGHLLEKIVRKRAMGGEGNKYLGINASNYHETATDLVGLRALHLFKEECFEIDVALRNAYRLVAAEPPVAYIREGDPKELRDRFEKVGLAVQIHQKGYRSVHYVIATRPFHRDVAVEVQVRTIFEEGWSEIDHKVRYPNFSDDPEIAYFLSIFNGLAGNADEMGSFVRRLAAAIEANRREVAEANARYERTLSQLDATVSELGKANKSSAVHQDIAKKLEKEVAELRSAASGNVLVGSLLSGLSSPGLGLKALGLGLTSPGLGLTSPGLGLTSPGLGLTSPSVGLTLPGANVDGVVSFSSPAPAPFKIPKPPGKSS